MLVCNRDMDLKKTKQNNKHIHISFLQCFGGLKFILICWFCLLLIAISSQKWKKNDGILFSNQSPTEGFNTHTHKINDKLHQNYVFNIFLNVSSKYPSTIFWWESFWTFRFILLINMLSYNIYIYINISLI